MRGVSVGTVGLLRGLVAKYFEFISEDEAEEMGAEDLIDLLAEELTGEDLNRRDMLIPLIGELNEWEFEEVILAVEDRKPSLLESRPRAFVRVVRPWRLA